MKISVICPTYNSELCIQRTIDSLINQTKVPSEVIFSDDGSIDSTLLVIKKNKEKFKEKNIKLTLLENEHCGPGKNRNVAMSNANENWFAFLDSDDSWELTKLERLNEYIKLNTNSNVFLNWEKYVKLNSKIIKLRNGINYKRSKNLLKQLYRQNFFSTSAIVIHKSLYKKFGGFDSTLPNAQDYDYWLKLSQDMELTIIPEFLGNYYETVGNITQRPYRKKIKSLIRISGRYKCYVGIITYYKKIFQIFFSKDWLKDLINFNL